jgi:hypothetical protein
MRPHASASSPIDPLRPVAAASSNLVRSALAVAVILGLVAASGLIARRVWWEWSMLMQEERSVASSAVIGFRNIFPVISRAVHPEPWQRTEGSDHFVWAGWQGGQGHRWFKLAVGDCDPAALGEPIGRDVARAIDKPDVEADGGEIWGRMPEDAGVAGLSTGRSARAYPRIVLGKVLIVNDVVDGLPRLVHHDPFRGAEGEADVSVYDARLEGRRILLASSGFTLGRRHVLYDRGTESLWVERGDGLSAFSGSLKGKTLPLIVRLPTTSWSRWRSDNPRTGLLVGAQLAPKTAVDR